MNLNAPARLGIFAAALGASLGVGLAVGAAVGPVDEDDAPPAHEVDHGEPAATTTHARTLTPSTADTSTSAVEAPGTSDPAPPSTVATRPSTTTTVDHSHLGHVTTEVQP